MIRSRQIDHRVLPHCYPSPPTPLPEAGRGEYESNRSAQPQLLHSLSYLFFNPGENLFWFPQYIVPGNPQHLITLLRESLVPNPIVLPARLRDMASAIQLKN